MNRSTGVLKLKATPTTELYKTTDLKYKHIFIYLHLIYLNKHFESSQKLLKSSFVNQRFKKYSMLPKELLTFETTNFTKTLNITES